MRKKIYIILSMSLFIVQANAQRLDMTWEHPYPSNQEEIVHDMIQSINGQFILVGETSVDKGEKDAFLLIVDKDGNMVDRIIFQEYGDNGFYAVKQMLDGSYLCAGYRVIGGSAIKSGWLVQTDERGNRLPGKERVFESTVNEPFEHLMILSGESFVAAGKKDDGWVGVYSFDQQWAMRTENIGRGAYAEIAGLLPAEDGGVVICGTTQREKKNKIRSDDVWIAELDKKLQFKGEYIMETPELEVIYGATITLDSQLLLTGSSFDKRKAKQDPWFLEIDRNGKPGQPRIFDTEEEDIGGYGVKTLYGKYYFTRTTITSYAEAIVLNEMQEQSTLPLTQSGEIFQPKISLLSFDHGFVTAGQTDDGQIKLTKFKVGNINTSIKGDDSAITVSRAPKLIDESRNNILDPGERGYLILGIKNNGDKHFVDGKIEINALNMVKGVNFFDEVYFSYIAKGGEKVITIPVNGGELLGAGSSLFEIKVKEQQENRKTIEVEIKCNQTVEDTGSGQAQQFSLSNVIIDWRSHTEEQSQDRQFRSIDGKAKLQVKAFTHFPLQKANLNVVINDIPVENQKSAFELVELQSIRPEQYEYTFNAPVTFSEKENKIYVEIEHKGQIYRSKPIFITYESRKPRLHALSIGPKHTLQYNGNDAIDFANALQQQAELGLYDDAIVDVLTTEEETEKTQIVAAFEALLNRYTKKEGADKIYPNDVLIIFISSHGIDINGRLKLVPSDYKASSPLSTTVDFEDDIIRFLDLINCKKVVFLDACHSGMANAKDLMIDPSANVSRALNDLMAARPGTYTISSSAGNELSFENELWQNGAFTEALLEAFAGKVITLKDGSTISADDEENEAGTGLLSLNELNAYLLKRVPDLVQRVIGPSVNQNPYQPLTKEPLDASLNFFKIINP